MTDCCINIWMFDTVNTNNETVPGTTALTFKGQVAKESCQKVHGVHNKDGDIGHLLHSLL